MGRTSKLTEKQWIDVEKRHIAGESMRALAKEYGVSEAAIRKRVSAQCAQIKQVANKLVEVEQELQAMPMLAQIQARNLADDLKAISSHLASSAKYGAINSHRLNYIANLQIEKIDESDPMSTAQYIQAAAVLTDGANESSKVGIGLIKANQDAVNRINKDNEEKSESKAPVFQVQDGRKLADT